MPSKKKKYNARFPATVVFLNAIPIGIIFSLSKDLSVNESMGIRIINYSRTRGRIKKIMQTDEEVGKVAQAVPVIISRTLELFVESLLRKTVQITLAKSAKTLSPSHMKQCILSESRFDFLKDLVKSLPDSSVCDEDNSATSGTGNINLLPQSSLPATGPSLPTEVISHQTPLPLQQPPCTTPDRETYMFSLRANPNFYTETSPVQSNNRGNHINHPSTITKYERSPTPPKLIVDEDYDT